MLGWLAAAITHDPYPAVRNLAVGSRDALQARGATSAAPLDPRLAAALRASAAQAASEIGE
jgi:hypothetical protein